MISETPRERGQKRPRWTIVRQRKSRAASANGNLNVAHQPRAVTFSSRYTSALAAFDSPSAAPLVRHRESRCCKLLGDKQRYGRAVSFSQRYPYRPARTVHLMGRQSHIVKGIQSATRFRPYSSNIFFIGKNNCLGIFNTNIF